jgi:hypothetical protein
MCDKCVEFDRKIERCRRLGTLTTDKLVLDGMQALVASYLAEKQALHPDPL